MENQGLPGIYMRRTNFIKQKDLPPPKKKEKKKKNNFKILVETNNLRYKRKKFKRQKKMYNLLRVRNYIHNTKIESNEKGREQESAFRNFFK